QDQFGASGRETLVSADNLLKIAAQIADRQINLSKANLHAAQCRLCASQQAAIPFSSRLMVCRRISLKPRLKRLGAGQDSGREVRAIWRPPTHSDFSPSPLDRVLENNQAGNAVPNAAALHLCFPRLRHRFNNTMCLG